jgi:hypothetical protein
MSVSPVFITDRIHAVCLTRRMSRARLEAAARRLHSKLDSAPTLADPSTEHLHRRQADVDPGHLRARYS